MSRKNHGETIISPFKELVELIGPPAFRDINLTSGAQLSRRPVSEFREVSQIISKKQNYFERSPKSNQATDLHDSIGHHTLFPLLEFVSNDDVRSVFVVGIHPQVTLTEASLCTISQNMSFGRKILSVLSPSDNENPSSVIAPLLTNRTGPEVSYHN